MLNLPHAAQMRKSCVYFRILPPGEASTKIPVATLTSIVDDMVPVRCVTGLAATLLMDAGGGGRLSTTWRC